MRQRDQASVPVESIRDDFDRIAALPDDRWDHNTHHRTGSRTLRRILFWYAAA